MTYLTRRVAQLLARGDHPSCSYCGRSIVTGPEDMDPATLMSIGSPCGCGRADTCDAACPEVGEFLAPLPGLRPGEADHVVPLSAGGSNALENLVIACIDCNRDKR